MMRVLRRAGGNLLQARGDERDNVKSFRKADDVTMTSAGLLHR